MDSSTKTPKTPEIHPKLLNTAVLRLLSIDAARLFARLSKTLLNENIREMSQLK